MTSIYGVGVDQVNLDRVRKLLSKNKSKFETRCFTKNEILYANRFNDGTHIKFVNNPKSPSKVVKNVPPKCEGYWRNKFEVKQHGTPGVGNRKEINSNLCGNKNAQVDI